MTEQPTGASEQVPPNEPAPPRPAVGGEGSAAEGSSGSPKDVEALIDARISELKAELPELVQGRIDSTKDRRFHQQSEIAGQIERITNYLEEAGGDAKQAVRNMALDRLVESGDLSLMQAEERREPAGRGRSVDPAAAMASSADDEVDRVTTQILREANIPFDDPQVRALANQQYASLDEWELTLRRHVSQRGKQTPRPGAVAVEGTRETPTDNPDLRRQYQERLEQIKGTRDPRALIDLRKEFEAKGLTDFS